MIRMIICIMSVVVCILLFRGVATWHVATPRTPAYYNTRTLYHTL